MMTALAASISLLASPLLSRATGPTAQFVEEQSDQSRRHMQNSVYFGQKVSGAMDALCAIFEQCHHPNWDGYGAAPIMEQTCRYACRFLESLPWSAPVPSVGAESDGHLTFEWHRSSRCTLSISISPDGNLHYAALLGISKAYGTEPFFGEMPQGILDLINRVWAA